MYFSLKIFISILYCKKNWISYNNFMILPQCVPLPHSKFGRILGLLCNTGRPLNTFSIKVTTYALLTPLQLLKRLLRMICLQIPKREQRVTPWIRKLKSIRFLIVLLFCIWFTEQKVYGRTKKECKQSKKSFWSLDPKWFCS